MLLRIYNMSGRMRVSFQGVPLVQAPGLDGNQLQSVLWGSFAIREMLQCLKTAPHSPGLLVAVLQVPGTPRSPVHSADGFNQTIDARQLIVVILHKPCQGFNHILVQNQVVTAPLNVAALWLALLAGP